MARIQVPLPGEAASATWSCFRARGHPSPSLCLSPVFWSWGGGGGGCGGDAGVSGRIFLFLHTGDLPGRYPRRDRFGGSVHGNQFFPVLRPNWGLLPLAAQPRSHAEPLLFRHLHSAPSITSVTCLPAQQLLTDPLHCPGPIPAIQPSERGPKCKSEAVIFLLTTLQRTSPSLRREFRTTPNVNSPRLPVSHLASLLTPNALNLFPPQALCTGCFFCLECLQCCLLHFPEVSAQVSPSQRLSLLLPPSKYHSHPTITPSSPTAKLSAPFMHFWPPLLTIYILYIVNRSGVYCRPSSTYTRESKLWESEIYYPLYPRVSNSAWHPVTTQ